MQLRAPSDATRLSNAKGPVARHADRQCMQMQRHAATSSMCRRPRQGHGDSALQLPCGHGVCERAMAFVCKCLNAAQNACPSGPGGQIGPVCVDALEPLPLAVSCMVVHCTFVWMGCVHGLAQCCPCWLCVLWLCCCQPASQLPLSARHTHHIWLRRCTRLARATLTPELHTQLAFNPIQNSTRLSDVLSCSRP